MAIKQTRTKSKLVKRFVFAGLLLLTVGTVASYVGMYWAFSTLGDPMPDWQFVVLMIVSWGGVAGVPLGIIFIIIAGYFALAQRSRT